MRNEETFIINRIAAEEWKLEKYHLLFTADAPNVCNGIGASYFPDWLRNCINKMSPTLIPTSMIHDMEYEIGGKHKERLRADWRFLKNGVKSAWRTFSIDQLRLYLVVAESIWFFILLRIGGGIAFTWRKGN